MILNAEELEIVAYLNSCPRQFVSMAEINRRAGGKGRFSKSPAWARGLMTRLVEAGLVEMDEQGHYRAGGIQPTPPTDADSAAVSPELPEIVNLDPMVFGDDYFPASEAPVPAESPGKPSAEGGADSDAAQIIGDDYFPAAD